MLSFLDLFEQLFREEWKQKAKIMRDNNISMFEMFKERRSHIEKWKPEFDKGREMDIHVYCFVHFGMKEEIIANALNPDRLMRIAIDYNIDFCHLLSIYS
jgi:hypothetical protein